MSFKFLENKDCKTGVAIGNEGTAAKPMSPVIGHSSVISDNYMVTACTIRSDNVVWEKARQGMKTWNQKRDVFWEKSPSRHANLEGNDKESASIW